MMIQDVSIEIIQKCWNRCLHCSSCSSEVCTTMLQTDTVKRVVAGLKKMKVERICLSGGEPLLHPDIIEIVRNISSNNIIVDVYTCGIIGTKEKPASLSIEILSQLRSAGMRALIFNMQSANETTYDLITQSHGHFPLLCESISNTINCGIQAEIHFVPMKCNLNDAEEVIRYAEKTGVTQVNFLKLVPHGRAHDNREKIVPNETEIMNLCNRISALNTDSTTIRLGLPLTPIDVSPPCHAVKNKLYIRFDGSVYGCEAFKYISFLDDCNHQITPDSILDHDIEAIYHESKYLEQSLILVNRLENSLFGCENCPVQKYLKGQGIGK